MTDSSVPKLVTVCFDSYPDARWDLDGARTSTETVRTAFGRHGLNSEDWSTLLHAEQLRSRLARELRENSSGGLVVYWIGHGEHHGRGEFFLATPSTVPYATDHEEFVSADWFGGLLRDDQSARLQAGSGAWRMVILDACESGTGVTSIERKFPEECPPTDLILVGTTLSGAAFTGDFASVLDRKVLRFERQTAPIKVRELRRLLAEFVGNNQVRGDVGPHATIPAPLDPLADVTATVPDREELRRIINGLPDGAINHLIPKAQGGDGGELVWHFEGRKNERLKINEWLNNSAQGMMIVTGDPGSGKSALLGMTYASTIPQLMSVLADLGYELDGPGLTPDGTVHIDAILHLRSLNITEILDAIVAELSLASTKSVDEVISQVRQRAERARLTLLVDALDEAQDPLGAAQSVIRRLALVPNCRVLLGTRVAPELDPDNRHADREPLLDLLKDATPYEPIRLSRDQWAIQQYAAKRLAPSLGRTTSSLVGLSISQREQPFLFASLAVREILADPTLVSDEGRFNALLDSGHRGVFARTIERINATNPKAGFLLWSLAYARGRGFPILDGIWQIAASALCGQPILAPDVDEALDLAGPYIVVDQEFGQAAYRLAHRTFQEFFLDRDQRLTVRPPNRGAQ